MAAYTMIALTVLSIGMQISAAQSARRRQARLQREAAERADLAKGFTFVTEGEAAPLPIFYGRNKVGGIRVYHGISSNYVFAEANGNSQTFCPYVNPDSKKIYASDANGNLTLSGVMPTPNSAYYVFPRGGEQWLAMNEPVGTIVSGITITLPKGDYAYYPKHTGDVANALPPPPLFPVNDPNGSMLINQTGEKREYLSVEQAICFDTISNVVHVIVDGKDWDHPSYSETMRIVVHKTGGVVDTLAMANQGRINAKYKHAVHLTGIFKLNRDDPQFNGSAPEVKLIIEGKTVRTVNNVAGELVVSTDRVYSNNPSYCLMDYLLDGVYGLGLSPSQLDLASFKQAAGICDIPVSRFDSTLANLKLDGDYWRRKGGTREYKLFECNLGLSSAKPIRENLELILETMGFAELIWSAGKYKLQLMHPIPVGLGYTFAENEVGYFQETNEYKRWTGSAWADDVVVSITDDDIVRASDIAFSWPGAQNRYNLVTVKFNNEAKGFSEDTATWPKRYSTIHNQFLIEDGQVPLEVDAFESGVTDYYHALAKAEQRVRISRRSTNYQFTLTRKHAGIENGDLLRITSDVLSVPGEVVRVESTKIEDNGNVSVEAYTYNCLDLAWNAKDTEIVASPNIYNTDIGQARNLRFTPISNTLAGSSGMLYWDRADDNTVVDYTVMYTTDPADLVNISTSWIELGRIRGTFMALPALIGGTFTLTVVSNTATRRAPFKSYFTGNGWPLLQVGVAPSNVGGKYSATLTVYARETSVPDAPAGGSYNFRTNTFITLPPGWYSSKPAGTAQLYLSNALAESDTALVDTTLDWTVPRLANSDPNAVYLTRPAVSVMYSDDFYDYTATHGEVVVIANGVDVTDDALFAIDAQVSCTVSINAAGAYYVTTVSADTAYAVFSITYNGETVQRTLTVSIAREIDVRDTTPPPTPTGISVTTSLNNIFISLATAPSYSAGGGHYSTVIYATTGSLELTEAQLIGEFIGTKHVLGSELGATRILWFRYKTKDAVESVEAFGPVTASTGFINGVDLNPLIMESLEIADGSITGVKISDNAITAEKISAGAIAVGSAAIANGAIVHAMIGDLAVDSINIAEGAIGSAKISGVLESDNFVTGYAGWQLRKDLGTLEVSQLVVHDGAGNVILSSGGIPYSAIIGKPGSLADINDLESAKLDGIAPGATVGAPAGTNVGGVAATVLATMATDYNAGNNRNGAAVLAPTMASDGTAVDHVINTDGSVDLSIEWAWVGDVADIDGFIIHTYISTSNAAYTFGTAVALETALVVPAGKRVFIWYGVAADKYYTVGVQAYRRVDKDIVASGEIRSAIVKPSLGTENPYLPSTSIAFGGNVVGTINNIPATSVNVWNSVTGTGKPANNATVGAQFGVNISGQMTAATASTYIANGAIAEAQIGTAAITSAKIQTGSIGTAHIVNGSITTALIGDLAVTTANIANLSVGGVKVKPPISGSMYLAAGAWGSIYHYTGRKCLISIYKVVLHRPWNLPSAGVENKVIEVDSQDLHFSFGNNSTISVLSFQPDSSSVNIADHPVAATIYYTYL